MAFRIRLPEGIPQDYVPPLIFLTGVVFVIGLPLMMYSLAVLYNISVWLFYITLILMAVFMRSTGKAINHYTKVRRR